LSLVSLDQRRESLDPDATLADTLTGGHGETVVVNGQARHVMSYMKDFLFTPEQARTRVGVLSGGERGRLALAVALARPGNLLVLDEPTNDLDLETLDMLQELLADHPGTVLLVSHDRDFLDRVATSVIAAEGDGRWVEYAGGYSDMLAQRGSDLPAAGTMTAAPPRARGGAEAPPAPAAKKMSFKDKHALATLPARLEALQAEIARAHRALSDPRLYSADPKAFTRATEALGRAELELAAAEQKWIELEMLREAAEGR
jgi:ATP-binding cassette subfamily F protein uup